MSEHEQERELPDEERGVTTDEERERRRQEHNEAVQHGGTTQIGDFSREQQDEERQAAEEEATARGNYLNENDPALPTAREEDLGEVAEDDRNADETRELQGENPGENREDQ